MSSILLAQLATSSHNSCFLEQQQQQQQPQQQQRYSQQKKSKDFQDFNLELKTNSVTMKYKRGSIVEVSVKDELCYHSWRCAQIVSGKGGTFTVSYDVYPGFTDKEDVERISVKYIRPCPPLLENSENWVPGDVVEVFHNLSWKMAIVLKDFGWDQFLVRLVGSFKELEVSKSELRVRQACQNGEWTVIGKVSRDNKDPNCNMLLIYNQDSGFLTKQREAEGDFYTKDLCFNNHLESNIVSSKTLKRVSPYGYSQGYASQGDAQKFRMSEKDGTRVRLLVKSPEKVDAIANNREMLCEKDLHIVKENINGNFGSSRALTLELNDSDSVVSSSGSCSINSYYGSGPFEEIEGHDSDAESICQMGYQEKIDQSPTNSALSDEIHRLELHAYRCTMEALHASGPLSWEKETMVTNLRMSLNISNDEHLSELKNLISAARNR